VIETLFDAVIDAVIEGMRRERDAVEMQSDKTVSVSDEGSDEGSNEG